MKRVCLLAILVIFLTGFVLPNTLAQEEAQECVNLAENTVFDSTYNDGEIKLCSGDYSLSDSEGDGVIQISGVDTFTLDCDGATLIGEDLEDSIAIDITDSSHITIENCKISNYAYGIQSSDSVLLTFTNNEISSASVAGIAISDDFMGSMIRADTISNSGDGILIQNSSSADIGPETSISDCSIGLHLEGSEVISITGNEFNNNDLAILIDSSSENIIHHNVFITTGSQAEVRGDSLGNAWDDGTEGNYWSDHFCEDQDSNGLCDEPYLIDVGFESDELTNQDNFPFMNSELKKTTKKTMTDRSQEIELTEGDTISISCTDKIYALELVSVTPPTIKVQDKTYTFTSRNVPTKLDFEQDKLFDVTIYLSTFNSVKKSAKLKITLLDPCKYFCGDNECLFGETWETCPKDCPKDADSDGYIDKAYEGDDCNDNDPNIRPGALEVCNNDKDDDCDGKIDLEDNECVTPKVGLSGTLIASIIILIVLSIIVVIVFFRLKSGKLPKWKPAPSTTPKESPRELVKERKIERYAQTYFKKGYSSKHVKEILLAEGWMPKQVSSAINKLISRGVGFPKPTGTKTGAIADLRKKVKEDLKKGVSKTEIRNKLASKGWSKTIIKVVFKGLK